MPVATLVKRAFLAAGLTVERRDPMVEAIPAAYYRSRILPPVIPTVIKKILSFNHVIERTRDVDGALVECGVSIGHGLLVWSLLHDHYGLTRPMTGFDSFEGFPVSAREDARDIPRGFYATPMELVRRMLREGRVKDLERVRLVKGFFEDTLPSWRGPIAILSLDCDIRESYETCFTHLFPHVVTGGVAVFDDYHDPRWPGAKAAVDEFLSERTERLRDAHGTAYIIKE